MTLYWLSLDWGLSKSSSYAERFSFKTLLQVSLVAEVFLGARHRSQEMLSHTLRGSLPRDQFDIVFDVLSLASVGLL